MPEENTTVRERRLFVLGQYPIDGQAVKRLAKAGTRWLEANRETVNALNVFPVPDGDTGTNMLLTMKAALEEIEDSAERGAGKMLDMLAKGALLGARGNSGVILSQLWRGFARSMEGKETLDAKGLAAGFAAARDTAYKGVVRPVEGTILTVAKDTAATAEAGAKLTDDPIELLGIAVKAAAESVQKTPELLPILKEAGVVDSGGKGFYFLLEGMLRWAKGEQINTAESSVQPMAAINLEHSMESVEEGQDYEVVVDFRPNGPLDLESFYKDLEDMGTSIQVGEGDGMYRMHIHVPTEKRYEPIDYTMGLGTVTNVAIENLMAQMDELSQLANQTGVTLTPVEAGNIAVVAVAPGQGIARHFAELGVAAIVEGGQTMNPSTADILAAFENLPTDKVIILPNNKNIILAAQASADLTVKKVAVIPTVSAPQGLAAMLRLKPDGDFELVVKDMTRAMEDIQTGEITTATRDVEIDGVKVQEGHIIALHNGKLVASTKKLDAGCLELLEKIGLDDYELITLFYGENISEDRSAEIADLIRKKYPKHEVEVYEGGQPHYQFIFSIE